MAWQFNCARKQVVSAPSTLQASTVQISFRTQPAMGTLCTTEHCTLADDA